MLKRVKALFQTLGRRPREGKGRDQAERVRGLYFLFREILAINDTTLQTIADIEDRLSGRVPFSMQTVNRRVQKTVMDIFVMVKNLNKIADGRYTELFEVLRSINQKIEDESVPKRDGSIGPLVISLEKLRRSDAALAGTKMANLGEVKNALGLRVPDGFVITTAAFHRFIGENELSQTIDRPEETLETYGAKVASEACRKVQTAVIEAQVPEELERVVFEAFDALAAGEEILVAVRSSALKEDETASHAGQYYTELNVGRGWILDAYRWVLASAFGQSAVAYRLGHGLTASDAIMAVGVIRMVQPRLSGIMFSRPFQDLTADRVLISVVPGLAAGLAGGSVSGHEIALVPGQIGDSAQAGIGPVVLAEMVAVARRLEKHFGGPQDVEWALDSEDKFYVLQSRPMQAAEPVVIQPKPGPSSPARHQPRLEGGLTACHGCGAGPVYQVRSDQDLDHFPDGAVLVALHSSPQFSVVMSHCTAIVTDQGSPTGHMSILAREFGVPAIVGLPGAMATLGTGQEVTVQASERCVYAGRVESILSECRTVPELGGTPAVRKLRRLAAHITPLGLVDPASPKFVPTSCRSLHDITRFVHEKVFEAMFHFSDKAASALPVGALPLEAHLPYGVLVFDLGGGFQDGAGQKGVITPAEITSIPLKAFLEGMEDPRIRWDQPRAVSSRGFLSVLGESMVNPPAEMRGVGKSSFATVSNRYMNFSTKAGYHFNTVDTWCGKSLNKNYIHFRFEGGGANTERRTRRCSFLETVLNALDFKATCRGDIVVARLEKYDQAFLTARLVQLGRLTLCCRQLDMLMDSDESPAFFAQAFLKGELHRF